MALMFRGSSLVDDPTLDPVTARALQQLQRLTGDTPGQARMRYNDLLRQRTQSFGPSRMRAPHRLGGKMDRQIAGLQLSEELGVPLNVRPPTAEPMEPAAQRGAAVTGMQRGASVTGGGSGTSGSGAQAQAAREYYDTLREEMRTKRAMDRQTQEHLSSPYQRFGPEDPRRGAMVQQFGARTGAQEVPSDEGRSFTGSNELTALRDMFAPLRDPQFQELPESVRDTMFLPENAIPSFLTLQGMRESAAARRDVANVTAQARETVQRLAAEGRLTEEALRGITDLARQQVQSGVEMFGMEAPGVLGRETEAQGQGRERVQGALDELDRLQQMYEGFVRPGASGPSGVDTTGGAGLTVPPDVMEDLTGQEPGWYPYEGGELYEVLPDGTIVKVR